MESILTSIKKLLGIAEEYEQFDADLIMHINSVLMILAQMGVGPSYGFIISGKKERWCEFMQVCPRLEAVKSYVYLKVKLLFDPPVGGALESTNNMIKELEWRLYSSEDF